MAKLIDITQTERIETPEGDWYDIMAVCKQEDINTAIATNLKIEASRQRVTELLAIAAENKTVYADEFTELMDTALKARRDLIARFLRAWSHAQDINSETIALISEADANLILSAIFIVVRKMRGVQADPKNAKPSDGSSTPLSTPAETIASGQ